MYTRCVRRDAGPKTQAGGPCCERSSELALASTGLRQETYRDHTMIVEEKSQGMRRGTRSALFITFKISSSISYLRRAPCPDKLKSVLKR